MGTPRQGLPLFTAMCVLIGTLVVIQLWLLAAAIDATLSDQQAVLLPATLASVVLLGINGALLLYALDFDRRLSGRAPHERD
ncbi:MAG: hypothetical protein IT361_15245 [Gemmatimonadaceae bacterium]|nr:hypothetical protein [Gemmatimonadaceae bacterium]